MRRAVIILGVLVAASAAHAETVPLPLISRDEFNSAGFCMYDGRSLANFVTWTRLPDDGGPCPAVIWWPSDGAAGVPESTPTGIDRDEILSILNDEEE